MADTPWTPGPWRADNIAKVRCSTDDWRGLIAGVSDGRYIGAADRKTNMDVARANARLMAAAPEMYDLLIEARSMLDSYYSEVPAIAARINALMARIKGEKANG